MGPKVRRRSNVKTSRPLTMSAFARLLAVDEKAVRKAITNGRLVRCVGRNGQGRAVIVNPVLGKQEWRQNSNREASRTPAATRRGPDRGDTLASAQRTVAVERARSLQLTNEQRSGRLIPAALAIRQAFDAARMLREAILNLPARLAGELAAETDADRVYGRLDAELRLALEATATKIQAAS